MKLISRNKFSFIKIFFRESDFTKFLSLGFENSEARIFSNAEFGEGKGPIWIDSIQCTGSESSLQDCTSSSNWNPR